jgi:arabinan endo-1,5-alpha-L-arabinosidase
VFPNGAPAATNTYTGTANGALWAPDCQYVNNQFRLFYAASSFGSQKVRQFR